MADVLDLDLYMCSSMIMTNLKILFIDLISFKLYAFLHIHHA